VRQEGQFSFDEKRQALEHWLASKPDSPTPRIALALLWEEYAWAGRGCDSANRTSDDQWKAFYERMAKAADLLQSVDHNADPEVYCIEMDMIPADEHPRARTIDLYDRATHAFPTVLDYAAIRYRFLFPKWFGQPGEAQAFAKSLLTEPGGEMGLSAYFEVARTALENDNSYTTLLDTSGIDYPTLVKAFASRARRFGPVVGDMNVLTFFAVAAKDFNTADLLAKKIGDDWEYSLWGGKTYVDAMLSYIWQSLRSARSRTFEQPL
jgi:hypothetical protein